MHDSVVPNKEQLIAQVEAVFDEWHKPEKMIYDIYFPQFPDEKACNKDLTDV